MWQSKRQPRIKKTCDFCNESAFGLMRRHDGGKTFCSPYCEASFINCRMIDWQETESLAVDAPHAEFVAALRYP
jgi:hypothetical protein